MKKTVELATWIEQVIEDFIHRPRCTGTEKYSVQVYWANKKQLKANKKYRPNVEQETAI